MALMMEYLRVYRSTIITHYMKIRLVYKRPYLLGVETARRHRFAITVWRLRRGDLDDEKFGLKLFYKE